MLKSYKTEIAPTLEQKNKIQRTIGTCRYVYNFFLWHNKERYDNGEKYLTAKKFSVWLNNEYIPSHPEVFWIKEVSSKAVKQSLEHANTAFMNDDIFTDSFKTDWKYFINRFGCFLILVFI